MNRTGRLRLGPSSTGRRLQVSEPVFGQQIRNRDQERDISRLQQQQQRGQSIAGSP